MLYATKLHARLLHATLLLTIKLHRVCHLVACNKVAYTVQQCCMETQNLRATKLHATYFSCNICFHSCMENDVPITASIKIIELIPFITSEF